jgi:hypothetical protein
MSDLEKAKKDAISRVDELDKAFQEFLKRRRASGMARLDLYRMEINAATDIAQLAARSESDSPW